MDFSFLEYTIDPSVSDLEETQSQLNRLGFVKRSQHKTAPISFWSQNNSIILLREHNSSKQPYVSGIGFNFPVTTLENMSRDLVLEDSSILSTTLENGLRILFVPEEYPEVFLLGDYELVDKNKYDSTGLEYFTGIILQNSTKSILEFFESIGFRLTKSSNQYFSLVSLNNRFTIMIDRFPKENKSIVSSVIVDTKDIFKTTACLTVTGAPIKKFNFDLSNLNFGKLNHKIVGYKCIAFGSEEKFTIENFIENALGSSDLIIRMRKQMLHVSEQSLNTYYENRYAAEQ